MKAYLADNPRAEAKCWPGGKLPAGHFASVDGASGLAEGGAWTGVGWGDGKGKSSGKTWNLSGT